MNYASDLWRKYEEIIAADDDYRRRREMTRLRLVVADAGAAGNRRQVLAAEGDEWSGGWTTYRVASGFAYDIARPGARSIRVMELCESTILYLVKDKFCADVDRLYANHRKILRAQFPSNAAWRRARRAEGEAWLKTDGRLNSWMAIREQLRTIEADECGHVAIRTRYAKGLNRRYQNLDFWLSDVPSEYRKDWFRAATRSGDRLPLVGVDISSSQLWVLATLLGDSELEDVLKRGSFWRRAAQMFWQRYPERVNGFTGPDDMRLIESCKSSVMTLVYGSPLNEVAKRLAEDVEEFGPGLDAGSVKLLTAIPELHLKRCLDWYRPATRKLGRVAFKMSHRRGFSFVDPFDGELVVWNPLRTKPKRIAGDSKVEICGEIPVRQVAVKVLDPTTGRPVKAHDLSVMRPGDVLEGVFMGVREVKVPGHKPRSIAVFRSASLTSADGTSRSLGELTLKGVTGHKYPAVNLEDADFEVWLKELEKRIGPCMAHVIDSDFLGNWIEQLVELGVRSIVPVHDCVYVPADDAWALPLAIEAAGEPFFKEIGSVIDAFESYLATDKTFSPQVRRMRERWRERVDAGKWPKLRSSQKE
jgi:hypothetical protein